MTDIQNIQCKIIKHIEDSDLNYNRDFKQAHA